MQNGVRRGTPQEIRSKPKKTLQAHYTMNHIQLQSRTKVHRKKTPQGRALR